MIGQIFLERCYWHWQYHDHLRKRHCQQQQAAEDDQPTPAPVILMQYCLLQLKLNPLSDFIVTIVLYVQDDRLRDNPTFSQKACCSPKN